MEVLVDEAEVHDAPAELGVEPCHAVAHYAVAVDTSHRGVATQALGVDLAEEEGVEVVDEVVGNLAGELGLYAQAATPCAMSKFIGAISAGIVTPM